MKTRIASLMVAFLAALTSCGGSEIRTHPSPLVRATTSPSSAANVPPSPSPSPSPSASDALALPEGRRIRVEDVTFSSDMRRIRLGFIGGEEGPAHEPCTALYAGWSRKAGDVLEVYVAEVPKEPSSGRQILCTAVGYDRNVVLPLERPFDGVAVADLGGDPVPLIPWHLGELWELPADAVLEHWGLQRMVRLTVPMPPGERFTVYAAGDFPRQDDASLLLTQSFDPQAMPGPGTGESMQVAVNGTPAYLTQSEPTFASLSWRASSGHVLTLYLRNAEVGPEELVAMAEAAQLMTGAP